MESSALVYVVLTLVTVLFAFCIENREHVMGQLLAGTGAPIGKYRSRQDARNVVAQVAVYGFLTAVSACRIAVGNDYWVYRENFKLIMQERTVASEIGFNYIVKFLQLLFGYDNYLPVFGFFSALTVFFFVKALRDQGSYFAFSLFLLMTNGYYFNSLNSVRYYLALAIALFSMKFVLRKEYIKFFVWVCVGFFFHKTVLFIIPFFLVARYFAEHGIKKWQWLVGVFLLSSLVWGQGIYRTLLFKIYPYYEGSAFDQGRFSYANIAKCLGVLVLCLICYKKSLKGEADITGEATEESMGIIMNRFYFLLNGMGLVVFFCGSFVPEVSRLGFYLIAPQIFLIPRVLGDMKSGIWKKLFYAGVIVAFAGYFVILLKGMYATDVRLLPYLNWIFD